MTAIEAAAALVEARRDYTAAVDNEAAAARSLGAAAGGGRYYAAGNYRAAQAWSAAARARLDAAYKAQEAAR